eukprot:3197589-Prymnesium_polylepis.2
MPKWCFVAGEKCAGVLAPPTHGPAPAWCRASLVSEAARRAWGGVPSDSDKAYGFTPKTERKGRRAKNVRLLYVIAVNESGVSRAHKRDINTAEAQRA